MLQKHTGRAAFPSDVPKIMRRLREAFEKAGENVFLIQTNRARGVRFALRTCGWSDTAMIGGDAS
jgi:DNA-binding winged helix-turn-helix (wHTH) protein